MNVYDRVSADSLEIGDQIIYEGEPIEVHSVDDNGFYITVKGYSLNEGDVVTREIHPDLYVDLYAV